MSTTQDVLNLAMRLPDSERATVARQLLSARGIRRYATFGALRGLDVDHDLALAEDDPEFERVIRHPRRQGVAI